MQPKLFVKFQKKLNDNDNADSCLHIKQLLGTPLKPEPEHPDCELDALSALEQFLKMKIYTIDKNEVSDCGNPSVASLVRVYRQGQKDLADNALLRLQALAQDQESRYGILMDKYLDIDDIQADINCTGNCATREV